MFTAVSQCLSKWWALISSNTYHMMIIIHFIVNLQSLDKTTCGMIVELSPRGGTLRKVPHHDHSLKWKITIYISDPDCSSPQITNSQLCPFHTGKITKPYKFHTAPICTSSFLPSEYTFLRAIWSATASRKTQYTLQVTTLFYDN